MIDSLTSPKGPEDLFKKARSLVSRMPSSGDVPEKIKEKIHTKLSFYIIENTEKDSPLREKLTSKLAEIIDSPENPLLDIITRAKENAGSSSLIDRAKDMPDLTKSINSTIEQFSKSLSPGEPPLSPQDKLIVQQITRNMKEYVHKRFENPLQEFCASARRQVTSALATRMNISRDKVSVLSKILERNFGTSGQRR